MLEAATILRSDILAGRAVTGSWLQIPSPVSAGLMARQGFRFLTLDAEHALFVLGNLQTCIAAIHAGSSQAFVRVPALEEPWIRRSLDAGAVGIICPMIRNAAQAAELVRFARYAPRGGRGFGFCQANAYGLDFTEYVAAADAATTVIAQIEHIDAVHDIDKILQVPGIDAVLIGPYDLAGSLGLPGQTGHEKVLAAIDTVLRMPRPSGPKATPSWLSGSTLFSSSKVLRRPPRNSWLNQLD
jgi:2-dehydro-3-deoxyglucarate aldolase